MVDVVVPGCDYQFVLSTLLSPARGMNVYAYFLQSLALGDVAGDVAEFGVSAGETSYQSRSQCSTQTAAAVGWG